MFTACAWLSCWWTTTAAWFQGRYPPCRTSTAQAHASAASSSPPSPPCSTSAQVGGMMENYHQPALDLFGSFCVFFKIFFSEELTPPTELLQMIVSWIQEDLRLVLITFLNTPLSGSQPISSLDVTPLGGLVRWCVKAPLAYRRDRKLALPNGTADSQADVGPLFSALHLGVLQVSTWGFLPGSAGTEQSQPQHLSLSTSRSSCSCPTF